MKKITTAIQFFICVFSLTSFAQYTKIYDFAGTTNGSKPFYTTLISDGTFLYGMTSSGGVNNNNGVLFKIMPDGTGYLKLLDFGLNLNGGLPDGSLIYDGTFLYGMTTVNGANSMGVLFKIKTDGTGYVKLLDFAGATNGQTPYGSLFSDGTFLYGMTSAGGANSLGVLFKIKTDGTSYTKLLDFAGTSNGSNPDGALISDGTYLYGMTANGGANSLGVIFKIKTDGTSYTKLLDFAGTTNGSNPAGTLYSDGTYLYGMTKFGGTNNDGVIFKIKTDGTSFTKLLDFAGASNGSSTDGTLISDGTFLYGMTTGGGANNDGTIFKIKTDGTGYVDLLDFSGAANGEFPAGSLYSDGTYLYGMAWKGGANNDGVIFKYLENVAMDISQTTNANNQITVYPNPSNNSITITSEKELGLITIYNSVGEIIYKEKINSTQYQIDLSKHAAGIYFLQMQNKQIKLIKE